MTHYSGLVPRPVYIRDGDTIAPGTTFAASVWVIDCPAFTGFPDGTTFAASVWVRNCPLFTGFPDGTTFAAWVVVRNCPLFTGFPDSTTFGSSVVVENCPAFTGSPDCTLRGIPIAYGNEASDRVRRIAAIVRDHPEYLKMSPWHTCDTTHCIPGHGVHQEGAEGYALERKMEDLGSDEPTADAGLILLGFEAAGMFYSDDDAARAWLSSKLAQS